MSGEQNPDKQGPKRSSRAGGRVPWRQDLIVLARLPLVERRHLAGESNVAIAAALEVDESTIREDLKRIRALWLEATRGKIEGLRAKQVARLDDIVRRALHQADWDEYCERAVLFDDPSLSPSERARLGLGAVSPGDPDKPLRVSRDSEGRAQFRGQKSAALGVARQALMDQAKLLGLVKDKQELSGAGGGDVPIRIVEVIKPDGGAGDPLAED